MGGKVWSDKEEQVFWEVIIPQSAIAADPNDQELSWESCGKVMQRTMGDEARRTYTGSMLCKLMPRRARRPLLTLLADEHYYQNLKPGPRPKAKKYFDKHVKDCGMYCLRSRGVFLRSTANESAEKYKASALVEESTETTTPRCEQPRKVAPRALPPPSPPPTTPAAPPREQIHHVQDPQRPTLPALSTMLDRRALMNQYVPAEQYTPPPYTRPAPGSSARDEDLTTPITTGPPQGMAYRALRPKPPLNHERGFQTSNSAFKNYNLFPRSTRRDDPNMQSTNPAFGGYDASSYDFRPGSFDTRSRLPPIQSFDARPPEATSSLGSSSGTLSESPGDTREPPTPSTTNSDSPVSYYADRIKRRFPLREEEEEDEEVDEGPTKRLRSSRRYHVRSQAPSTDST